MEVSWVLCAVAVFVITSVQVDVLAQVSSGNCRTKCGFQSVCENSTCVCPVNYVLHSNGKDCRNASCTTPDCLQCATSIMCTRCESFISASTGTCLTKCEGSAEMHNESLICTESKSGGGLGVRLEIAIVAGVACGAALCIIVIVAVCIYIRKSRRNINLQSKDYNNRQTESGQVKQFPAYENNAYEPEAVPRANKIDPLEYASELDKLRPHADTLMELLSQVRSKKRAMDSSDERVPTYKGVIHQLCRVLVLVHKRDPVVSIPSDAMGLIHWAQQMLEDHREQQNYSGGCPPDFPIAHISSADLDFDNPNNPVYATPERSRVHDPVLASMHNIATPYSSAPIPVSEAEQHHYGTGKKPGFATISRARAKPNSDLIRALEADLNNTGASAATYEHMPVSQNHKNGFIREDLQNFLIHAGEKSGIKAEPESNTAKNQNTSDPPIPTNNQESTSGQDFNFELTQKLKNRINKAKHKSLFMDSTQIRQPDTLADDPTIGSLQLTKRNIITNPNVVKKSGSLPGKNAKYATPQFGFVPNGHYYDPNPMPNLDAEVYAPGSGYSDHSNIMSTFLGDLPPSESSSDRSEFGDDESENSGGDLDVFHFDPKDCTEPVEV